MTSGDCENFQNVSCPRVFLAQKYWDPPPRFRLRATHPRSERTNSQRSRMSSTPRPGQQNTRRTSRNNGRARVLQQNFFISSAPLHPTPQPRGSCKARAGHGDCWVPRLPAPGIFPRNFTMRPVVVSPVPAPPMQPPFYLQLPPAGNPPPPPVIGFGPQSLLAAASQIQFPVPGAVYPSECLCCPRSPVPVQQPYPGGLLMISSAPNQPMEQQPALPACEALSPEVLQPPPMYLQDDQLQEPYPKPYQPVLVSLPVGFRPDGAYGLLHPSVSPDAVDRHSTFYVNQGLFHQIAIQQEMLSRSEMNTPSLPSCDLMSEEPPYHEASSDEAES